MNRDAFRTRPFLDPENPGVVVGVLITSRFKLTGLRRGLEVQHSP